jgi:hypothetical protein
VRKNDTTATETIEREPKKRKTTQPKEKRKPRNSSGFYGVRASGSKWYAMIFNEGKRQHLGSFRTKEEAAVAYDEAARKFKQGTGGVVYNFETAEAGEAAAKAAVAVWEVKNPLQPKPKTKTKPRPVSGFYGVAGDDSLWRSTIRYGGELHHLGIYRTKEEAAVAHDAAAREHKQGDKNLVYNYETEEVGKEAAKVAVAAWEIKRAEQELNSAGTKRPASGFYGVRAGDAGKWQATIYYGGKKHSLRTFRTKEEAAVAYDAAAREHKAPEGGKIMYNFESAEAGEAAAAKAVEEWERVNSKPKPKPASGYYGVGSNGQKWQATICYGSKRHRLGSFRTKEEAAAAYDKAARENRPEGVSRQTVVFNFKTADEAEASVKTAVAEYERQSSSRPQPDVGVSQ